MRDRHPRKSGLWLPILGLALLLCGAGVAAWLLLQDSGEVQLSEFRPPVLSPAAVAEDLPEEVPESESEISASKSRSDSAENYKSPVDFDALRKLNPDIIAWLDIPGTDVSYPVCQSQSDAFYLDHNWLQEESLSGALFTEKTYNQSDFSDPVNIIYGHNMRDRTMFGSLQPIYTNEDNLEAYGTILLYLPDREIRYRIFAAVPYDGYHLLAAHDFTSRRIFRLFFKSVFQVHSLDASFRTKAYTENRGNILVLSTCCDGSRSQRYLVFARAGTYCAPFEA